MQDYYIPNAKSMTKDDSNQQTKKTSNTNDNDELEELYHDIGNTRNPIKINVPDSRHDGDGHFNEVDTFISVSDIED
jgi:hypothetical protein